jgi:hypothetical protein
MVQRLQHAIKRIFDFDSNAEEIDRDLSAAIKKAEMAVKVWPKTAEPVFHC